ncbi:putative lysophospholipase BODYGUARD 4 [Drosera capensis]
MVPTLQKWTKNVPKTLHFLLTFITFLFLDFLDSIFCIIYGFIDHVLEGKPSHCYCKRSENGVNGSKRGGVLGREMELSETLYGRRNVFRVLGLIGFEGKVESFVRKNLVGKNRWSDCGCEECVAWMKKDSGDLMKLHVVVQEPCANVTDDSGEKSIENVVFIHGFMSSSSCWTESVFKNLSDQVKLNYRMLAFDLLGFGRSPKPQDCLYTIGNHLETIEESVISPYKLESFHLVGHSMGCVIAMALAAKYSTRVKSLTLVAPPYFPPSSEAESLYALNKLVKKRLWPVLHFGGAFMSWYEHLGRFVCFVVCRNHRIWESLLKLLTGQRTLNFMFTDLFKHTHHSAWHSMHNVLCGGIAVMERYLEKLWNHGVKISVIHGDQDQVVPLECSYNIKMKVPEADIKIVPNTDHSTIIADRIKEFTRDLERTWISSH